MYVAVRENNVDQALRVLKKKMQREGMFREMKNRRNFEKPSDRRAREAQGARRAAPAAGRKTPARSSPFLAPAASRHPPIDAAASSARQARKFILFLKTLHATILFLTAQCCRLTFDNLHTVTFGQLIQRP